MTTVPAGAPAIGFSLVGPGRVGTSLAHWLVGQGARLTSVGGRTSVAGAALAGELGGRTSRLDELDASADDLLLIAVADSAIAEVAEILAARPQAAVALHVSGAVSVEALAPLRSGGSAVGGLHPLRAFPAESRDPVEAEATLFALGGDAAALALARRLVETWNGHWMPIEDGQRPLYHLAASLAAGGIVTLLATAVELAERAGLHPAVVDGYHALARQAVLESGRRPTPADAITGPVARGDLRAVESHLAALGDHAPEALDIFVALARETLRHTAGREGSAIDHSKIVSTLAKVMERKSFLDQQ